MAGLGRGTAQTDQRYPGSAGQSAKSGTQPRGGGTDPDAELATVPLRDRVRLLQARRQPGTGCARPS